MPKESYKSGFFSKGDLVVYAPVDADGLIYKCEIGVIKSINEERQTAFVAYDTGDTCANTDLCHLLKVQNDYAVRALAERMEQLGHPKLWSLADGCEDWGINDDTSSMNEYISSLERQSAKEEAEIMEGKEYAKSLECNDDEKLEQASEAQREAEELGIFPGTTVLDENGSYTVISIFTDSRGACALLSDDGDGRTIMAVPLGQFDELGFTVA